MGRPNRSTKTEAEKKATRKARNNRQKAKSKAAEAAAAEPEPLPNPNPSRPASSGSQGSAIVNINNPSHSTVNTGPTTIHNHIYYNRDPGEESSATAAARPKTGQQHAQPYPEKKANTTEWRDGRSPSYRTSEERPTPSNGDDLSPNKKSRRRTILESEEEILQQASVEQLLHGLNVAFGRQKGRR
jgi:hypothetical protein